MEKDVCVIDRLSKRYPDFALQDISLRIPRGAITGFIGENGAGKSTTIKLMLDLVLRDGGTVTLFGKDNILQGKEIREDIGTVFSELNLPGGLRAGQVARIMSGIYAGWEDETFFGLLKRFGLKKEMKIKDHSRGMKMKLAIAIALSHQAHFLILDEPTSGLDPVVRDEILDIFLEFIQDEEHSIFLSSHIVSDLEKIADHIALIHKGRLLFCEEKDLLLERYGLLKAPEETFRLLPPSALIGHRKSRFGSEALVEREALKGIVLPENAVLDPAGMEDIMLHFVKEERS